MRVDLNELKQFPRLEAIAQRSMADAVTWVGPWLNPVSTASVGAHYMNLRMRCPGGDMGGRRPLRNIMLGVRGDELRAVYGKLIPLGRLALPAVEALLTAKAPLARLHGLALSNALDLQPAPATLAMLQMDPSQFGVQVFRANMETKDSTQIVIALEATELSKLYQISPRFEADERFSWNAGALFDEWFKTSVSCVPEMSAAESLESWRYCPMLRDVQSALSDTGADEASNEQDYWNRARYMWRAWHRFIRGQRVYDRDGWLNVFSSYQGVQDKFYSLNEGRPQLTIVGPEKMKYEIKSESVGGRISPVKFKGKFPFVSRGFLPDDGYRLRVRDSNGRWRILASTQLRSEAFTRTLWVEPSLWRKPRNASEAKW